MVQTSQAAVTLKTRAITCSSRHKSSVPMRVLTAGKNYQAVLWRESAHTSTDSVGVKPWSGHTQVSLHDHQLPDKTQKCR